MKAIHAVLSALLPAPLAAFQLGVPITKIVGMMFMPVQSGTFSEGRDRPRMEDFLRQERFGQM